MLSQYMLDPNLFISARTTTNGQKHGTDSRLRWLWETTSLDQGFIAVFVFKGTKLDADAHLQWVYNLLEKDMGRIVVFGGNDEFMTTS